MSPRAAVASALVDGTASVLSPAAARTALGPIAAGLLVARLGYASMFHVMAVVALTMAFVFVMMTSRHSAQVSSARGPTRT